MTTAPNRGREEGTRRVSLSVPSMDCASCVRTVGGSLEQLDGVVETDLRPTTGTAVVTYDPGRLSEEEVVGAIEGIGYEVTSGASDDGDLAVAEASDVWRSGRARKTYLGAVLLALGLAVEFLPVGANATVATVLDHPLSVADTLLLAATASGGLPVVRGGYYSLRSRSLDIDLLMATAILAATAIGYYEEAATLAVLYGLAELLEDYAMDRTRDSIRELVELSPREATVLRGGEERTVPVSEVEVGDVVAVRPGERIPVDGVVVEGSGAVDESAITGESVPADKRPGEEVYAGTVNGDGYLEVETTSEATGSTLARIIESVRAAGRGRTEREQFIDRFTGYYTPAVVVLAALTAAVPPLVWGLAWETWFVRGLTFLVIACPCAFVISTPVSVVSGITSAARNGVLIEGGEHLEAVGEVGAVAFDKTGTLTRGELAVTDVVAFGDRDGDEVLRIARSVEERSEHPIARAIVEHADAEGVEALPVSGFESVTGEGVGAEVEGTTYYAGKPDLFDDRTNAAADGGSALDAPRSRREVISTLESEGKTVVLVGTETEVLGAVAVADEVRPEAAWAVRRLREAGVEHAVMLTGDNEGTARAIAGAVGVDEYRAGLLPDEKAAAIEELEGEYGTVAMVGDGINDAPALAAATVGIAMGAAGTDAAIETADVALMADDLSKLPYLHALSRRANGVIRQNVWSSLAVKALLAVGIPLGYVSVAVAVVVGDMGMSLGVTGNAMRLSRVEPEPFVEE